MGRIIKLESELVAHTLILRTCLVVVPVVVAAAVCNLIVSNTLWIAINYSVMSIAPMAGYIHISNRLPKLVAKFVQEKLPEHIEYASSRELFIELLCRHRQEVKL